MTLKLFLVNEPLSSRCPHSAGLEDFDPYPFVTNNLRNIVFTSTINMNTLQVQLQVGGKCEPVLKFVLLQKTVYGANVVIFEGILAFANKELLKVRISVSPPLCFTFLLHFSSLEYFECACLRHQQPHTTSLKSPVMLGLNFSSLLMLK